MTVIDSPERELLHIAALTLADSELEVVGPVAGSEMTATDQLDLFAFRERELAKRAPWLLQVENQRREQQADVDRRSTHVLARRDGALVGALRITLAPFEFATNSDELAELARSLRDYLEFGRFVVDPHARQLAVSRCLLAAAVHRGLGLGARGVVALCRRPAALLFQRFGLRSFDDRAHRLRARHDQEYFLLCATWPQIADALRADRRLALVPDAPESHRSRGHT